MSGAATYDPHLHARALATSTPTLHEAAGRRGELPPAIKPLAPGIRVCGPAFPVQCAPGDNLWIHHALYAATPGEVLVVNTGAPVDCAYFGDIMTIAAQLRGIGGLVVQGGVRDVQRILELGFPVFCTASCIRGPSRDASAPGSIGVPVRFGDVEVARGDLVVGDADGVIVLPALDAERIVADAGDRERREQSLVERLRAGETTLGIFGVPAPRELRKP